MKVKKNLLLVLTLFAFLNVASILEAKSCLARLSDCNNWCRNEYAGAGIAENAARGVCYGECGVGYTVCCFGLI